MIRGAALVLACCAAAADVHAQPPSLPRGTLVRVQLRTDVNALRIPHVRYARVRAMDADSLSLDWQQMLGGRTVAWGEVVRLDTLAGREGRAGRARNAWIGAAAGAVVGVLLAEVANGAADCGRACSASTGARVAGAGIVGVLGFGVGAAVPARRVWCEVTRPGWPTPAQPRCGVLP